ncbi:hypothetical protein ZWY2020_048593 [Hordeum vulgare]|nr:hypothetical protein ZWY2020_048593 [Hordeum vulgare]
MLTHLFSGGDRPSRIGRLWIGFVAAGPGLWSPSQPLRPPAVHPRVTTHALLPPLLGQGDHLCALLLPFVQPASSSAWRPTRSSDSKRCRKCESMASPVPRLLSKPCISNQVSLVFKKKVIGFE